MSVFSVSTLLGHTSLAHRTALARISRFVALVTDSGFITLLAFAVGFALAFLIIGLVFYFPWEQSVLHRHLRAYGARLPHEERSITSALTCAQEFSLAELPQHVFLNLR